MRIGIDCSLVPGARTGIGEYCHQLTHALSRVDRENTYRLYPAFFFVFHPAYRYVDLPETSNMKVAFRDAPRLWVRLLRHPYSPWFLHEWLLGRVDVVHSTSFSAPRFYNRRKRLVMTIYDLSFLVYPEFHLPENVKHALLGTREAIARADALITISHHSRRDLLERLGVAEDRVTVTHLAASPHYIRVDDPQQIARVRERYHLPAHFILFVGSLEPRKNVRRLIQAYAKLPTSLQHEVHLVIAGGKGWLNTDVYLTVHQLGLEGRVQFVGYVEENDLPSVYSLATVFAYPSLYEGFGLPVLEAMQCGVPVLTSNVSALPEVAGEAALLVSPTEVEEIAEGLACLLEDADLRVEFQARGYRRAREFSWERCARETLAVYRSVV
jgi:glycosyltransferase involved in cell wall biosynthesis